MHRRIRGLIGCAIGSIAFAAASANAAINLEWRPSSVVVNVGQPFSLGLYAVSDNTSNQSFQTVDAILDWDASFISLTGNTNNGPYAWLSSGFPNDSGLDGLNNTWADGNAFYRAQKPLVEPPAFAPPAGILVTTINFVALAETPSTLLEIPASFGSFTQSFIIDGFTAGLRVTGTLGSAKVTVVPEPVSGLLLALGALGIRRRRR